MTQNIFIGIILSLILIIILYELYSYYMINYEKLLRKKYPQANCFYDENHKAYYINISDSKLHISDFPRGASKRDAWIEAYELLKSKQ